MARRVNQHVLYRDVLRDAAKRAAITETEMRIAADALMDAMQDAIRDGGKMRLPKIGTFYVQAQARRKHWDESTQQVEDVPARNRVRFQESAGLRRHIASLPLIVGG